MTTTATQNGAQKSEKRWTLLYLDSRNQVTARFMLMSIKLLELLQ
jgi:hypothetical protein